MTIVISEAAGVRQLRFGTHWCQGALRVAAPDDLVLEYAQRMCAWLLFHDLRSLADQHVLTLGLGAGSLTRFAHRVLGTRATAVEIDADVIAACRTHFMLPPDGDGLRVVHDDAAAFMAHARGFDVIQVDAYDAGVEKPALDGAAFYADCRAALREGGTVAVNLIGRGLDVREGVGRMRKGLNPRLVWQFPPTDAGNVVVIAHCGEPPPESLLSARALEVEARYGLPASEWVALARRWLAAPLADPPV